METFAWQKPVAAHSKVYFLDHSFAEIEAVLLRHGFKSSSAQIVYSAVVRHGLQDYADLKGRISKSLILWLTERSGWALNPIASHAAFPSDDGSTKYRVVFTQGGEVECVAMPFEQRLTFCLSSQVGCAMGCTFCATGSMGFGRNLSPAEIAAQVLLMRPLHPSPRGQTIRTNIVFMGMGEPLHNLTNVLSACGHFNHPLGLVIHERDLAISTSGLVPKIRELASSRLRPQLMVSIAATQDADRSAVMPVNRAYPLEELLTTLESFPLRPKERIMLSYVLIRGVNDSDDDADRLVAMAKRIACLVNLIPMNEHQAAPDMLEPRESRIQAFATRLIQAGVFATIRRSRGRDVAAACGQLVRKGRKNADTFC
ncbi:MAG: 23S rRNA (adenine(2503)-C(2))-methyltransferase RlmN [Acidobacteria bacterium]|nr:23S rRNA (adenine(2503)-C(2))-methyltransferase RlmN [Acidobacteriota bacterium]MCB9397532.1 23S rRNA (adenine(2503)-C(2))-methyltransferase RlmN [Acidobacteriota bacterium]